MSSSTPRTRLRPGKHREACVRHGHLIGKSIEKTVLDDLLRRAAVVLSSAKTRSIETKQRGCRRQTPEARGIRRSLLIVRHGTASRENGNLWPHRFFSPGEKSVLTSLVPAANRQPDRGGDCVVFGHY